MKYQVRIGEESFEIEIRGPDISVNGSPVSAVLVPIPQTPVSRLLLAGRTHTFALTRLADGYRVQAAGSVWSAEIADERTRTLRELAGESHRRHGAGIIRAPMPGLVLRIEVAEGQSVQAGAGLVVLEAMKMENEIRVPVDGVIRKILVKPGQAVEKGAHLIELAE